MRIIFFLGLSCFFPFSALSSTLGEAGAAAGIASELGNISRSDPSALVKQVREQLKPYNEAEQKRPAGEIAAPPSLEQDPGGRSPQNLKEAQNPLGLAEKQIKEEFQDQDERSPQSIKEAQSSVELMAEKESEEETQNQGNRSPQGLAAEEQSSSELMTEEEVAERLQDQKIETTTKPVDYKAGIQVFYKNTCSDSKKNCHRGAVLTNIKSVIFNYAHERGNFAKLQAQKKKTEK